MWARQNSVRAADGGGADACLSSDFMCQRVPTSARALGRGQSFRAYQAGTVIAYTSTTVDRRRRRVDMLSKLARRFLRSSTASIVMCAVASCSADAHSPESTDAGTRSPVVDAASAAAAGAAAKLDQRPSTAEHARQPADQSCVQLTASPLDSGTDELQIQYACGIHSAHTQEYSAFLDGATPCENPPGFNTFALKLIGSAAARYSAVVRCGYIRYDNGTFVGSRVETEARDGQWCHEPALDSIQLADRMLLTDVAFAIEALDSTAPTKHLAVQFLTRSGRTRAVPAEDNLCLYVAHRAPGNWTCSMVAPTSYCTCPCDPAWDDFPTAMTLSLAQN